MTYGYRISWKFACAYLTIGQTIGYLIIAYSVNVQASRKQQRSRWFSRNRGFLNVKSGIVEHLIKLLAPRPDRSQQLRALSMFSIAEVHRKPGDQTLENTITLSHLPVTAQWVRQLPFRDAVRPINLSTAALDRLERIAAWPSGWKSFSRIVKNQ